MATLDLQLQFLLQPLNARDDIKLRKDILGWMEWNFDPCSGTSHLLILLGWSSRGISHEARLLLNLFFLSLQYDDWFHKDHRPLCFPFLSPGESTKYSLQYVRIASVRMTYQSHQRGQLSQRSQLSQKTQRGWKNNSFGNQPICRMWRRRLLGMGVWGLVVRMQTIYSIFNCMNGHTMVLSPAHESFLAFVLDRIVQPWSRRLLGWNWDEYQLENGLASNKLYWECECQANMKDVVTPKMVSTWQTSETVSVKACHSRVIGNSEEVT